MHRNKLTSFVAASARLKAAAFTAAAMLLLAGCGGGGGSSPAPAVTTAPSNANPIPPQAAVLLGVWALPNDAPVTTSATNIAALETAIGRRFALSMHYDSFRDVFPSPQEQADLQFHRIPIISLQCNDTDYNIAHGSQDAFLIAKAAAIKAFGEPVFLRYKWEFNLPDTSNGRLDCHDPVRDQNGYFTPPEFIAAYQHIHDLMIAQGATNIAWVWNASTLGVSGIPYFPGDSYVDWVGIDDYDRNSTGTSIFSEPYSLYAPVGNGSHPVIVAETGAVQSDQVNFFDSLPAALQTQYPHIKALSYFDAAGPADNYTLTGAGLEAFARFAADQYLSAITP